MGVLQLRRLTTTNRLLITPAIAEPIWDLTLKELFIGDGIVPLVSKFVRSIFNPKKY